MTSPFGSKKRQKFLTFPIDGVEVTKNIGETAEYFCMSKPQLHQLVSKYGSLEEAMPKLLEIRKFKIEGGKCQYDKCEGTGIIPPGSSMIRKYCCARCSSKSQRAGITDSVRRQVQARKLTAPVLTCTVCGKDYQNLYQPRKAPTCQSKSCIGTWKRTQIQVGLAKKVADNREAKCLSCTEYSKCTDRVVFDGVAMPKDKTDCHIKIPERNYRSEALGNMGVAINRGDFMR